MVLSKIQYEFLICLTAHLSKRNLVQRLKLEAKTSRLTLIIKYELCLLFNFLEKRALLRSAIIQEKLSH